MGFLDDIKKNVENAVEGMKENVQDALHHRQHQDDASGHTASAETAPPASASAETAPPAAAPADELTPAETATMDAPTPAPVAEGPTAETSPAAAPPAAQGTEPTREIVVESGDTLSGIAAQFGVDREALIAANAETVPNPDAIYPGQILRLP